VAKAAVARASGEEPEWVAALVISVISVSRYIFLCMASVWE
jgi:hypothetical protein